MDYSAVIGLSQAELENFDATLPRLVEDLVGDEEVADLPGALKWLKEVVQYNLPHGKKLRGLTAAMAVKCLIQEPTEEDMKLAYVLGWCVEMLQSCLLVADDMMDKSETRRGRLCWYLVDNKGATAINDAFLLEQAVYRLLAKYFGGKPYFFELRQLFIEISYKTFLGQSLDTRMGETRNMEEYTMDKYRACVAYKGMYYAVYLPLVGAGMIAGKSSPQFLAATVKIGFQCAEAFQVENDFLDVYGDPQKTGKEGTDIETCRCSWMFITATNKLVDSGSEEERKMLWENYGKEDPRKVAIVKGLYDKLDLATIFEEFKEGSAREVARLIGGIGGEEEEEGMKQMFYNMVGLLYGQKCRELVISLCCC